MHEVSERQMTDDERKRLLACMPLVEPPSLFRTREFKCEVLQEIVAFLIAIVILILLKKVPIKFIVWAAPVIYALTWLFRIKSRILVPLREQREAKQRILDFRNAVNAAQTVRVHLVKAEAVIQVTHDEGTVCLFDLGGNQTYWIDPYDLLPGRPTANWPNNEFEIIGLTGWEKEFGPFCLGKKLNPKETYEFDDLFATYDLGVPADGIINQSLDDYVKEAEAKNLAGSDRRL